MIRPLRLLAAILTLLLAGAPAAAATYTLAPSQDTDVRENGGGGANCGCPPGLVVARYETPLTRLCRCGTRPITINHL